VCSEHGCDPCYQPCKCSGPCADPLAFHAGGSDEPYRIIACASRVQPDGEQRVLRTFTDIVGPSVALAPRPLAVVGSAPAAEELARFAARVLAVNRELFPVPHGARWALDGVDSFGSASVVGFHQASADAAPAGSRPFHSNGVQMLFDGRGSLVEVGQVFERGVP